MPTFTVYTNISKDSIPKNFLKDATGLIAGLLGKPDSYVTVRVHPEQMMSHGGNTDDPCGCVELYSIGGFGPEKNDDHAKKIADFIHTQLKIPTDRFYVTFVDLQRSDVALGGKTFSVKK